MLAQILIKMEVINAKTFIENFDEVLERISNGERISIESEYGQFEIIPKDKILQVCDDFDSFRNHDDGC